MKRNRTWKARQTTVRTQRNRQSDTAGSLNETLDIDFRSGSLPPACTFTRSGTTATNVQGVFSQNLVKQSNTLGSGGSAWFPSAEITVEEVASVRDPFDSGSAYRIRKLAGTTLSQQLTQTLPAVAAGQVYTLRFWARKGLTYNGITDSLNSGVQIGLYSSGASPAFVAAVPTVISGPGAISGSGLCTVTGLGDQWSQFQVVFTISQNETHTIRIYPGNASFQAEGLNVFVFGVHLCAGNRITPFVATTTATVTNPVVVKSIAANTPRFEYRPDIGRIGGLLVEGSSINYCRNTEDQSAANWTVIGTSTKSGKSLVIAGLDGTFSLNKLTPPASPTRGGIYHAFSATSTLNGYTPVVGDYITVSVWVACESGTTTASFGYSNATTIVNGNSFTVTTTPTRQNWTFQVTSTSATSYVSLETTNGVALLWWGFQIEKTWRVDGSTPGAGASSYIPTTNGNVSRSKESLLISTSTNRIMQNPNKGTLAISFWLNKFTTPTIPYAPLLSLTNVTNNASMQIACNGRDVVGVSNSGVPITTTQTVVSTLASTAIGTRQLISYSQDSSIEAGQTGAFLSIAGVSQASSIVLATADNSVATLISVLTNSGVADGNYGSIVVERIRYAPYYLTNQQAAEFADTGAPISSFLPSGNLGSIRNLDTGDAKYLSLSGGTYNVSEATSFTVPTTGTYYFNTVSESDVYFEVSASVNGAAPAYVGVGGLALNAGDSVKVNVYAEVTSAPGGALVRVTNSTNNLIAYGNVNVVNPK
jgi:hypothetical protein